jgi:flagellar biosynthetic protein FliO
MKRAIVGLILLMFLVAVPAFASQSLNHLKSAEVKETKSKVQVSFELTKPELLKDAPLELNKEGSLVWVDIPNSYDKIPKRLFWGWKSNNIRGVGARRKDNNVLTIRVLINEKSLPDNIDWVRAAIKDGHLVMTFFKEAPSEDALALAGQGTSPVVPTPTPAPDVAEAPITDDNEPIDLNAIFGNTKLDKDSADSDAAADQNDKSVLLASTDGAPSMASVVIKFVSAMMVVLGILFVAVWAAKRFKLPQKLAGGDQKMIRVVGATMIGLKKQISVIDVAGQFWVVGHGPSSITLLGKVDDPLAIERLSSGDRQASILPNTPSLVSELTGPQEDLFAYSEFQKPNEEPAIDFGQVLEQRKASSQDFSGNQPSESSALQSIRERLENLKKL